MSVGEGGGVASRGVSDIESAGDIKGDDRGEAPGMDRHPATSNRSVRTIHLARILKCIRSPLSITL